MTLCTRIWSQVKQRRGNVAHFIEKEKQYFSILAVYVEVIENFSAVVVRECEVASNLFCDNY